MRSMKHCSGFFVIIPKHCGVVLSPCKSIEFASPTLKANAGSPVRPTGLLTLHHPRPLPSRPLRPHQHYHRPRPVATGIFLRGIIAERGVQVFVEAVR